MSDFPRELCIALKAKLYSKDTENQTYGCRHTNPNICGYCYLENVCAFASNDGICKHPSAKWKKVYKELKEDNNEVF